MILKFIYKKRECAKVTVKKLQYFGLFNTLHCHAAAFFVGGGGEISFGPLLLFYFIYMELLVNTINYHNIFTIVEVLILIGQNKISY